MRIGIDARFYGPIGKGLGRYTQKLIENLEKVDEDNQYFIFLKKENFNEYIPKNKNFKKILADFQWYSLEEQIKFPRLLNKYNLDLAHFPHFNVPLFYFKKFVVTIHDLILIHFPTVRGTTLSPLLYWLKFFAYKIVIKSAIYRSNRVIAVSKFTKDDILKNYKRVPSEKIKVTYEACDDFCMLSPNKDEEIIARYGIIKPYILYVGNAYPHKNPERLIFGFDEARKKRKDMQLVFVGAEDYFYLRLKQMAEEKKIGGVIFAGFVPDYELDIIFHNALAYVRPSLYEGFELPPLEAMAKGVPVIISSHSCALEILGDSALYFDPYDTKDITQKIEKIASDENLRKELIKKGYEQIKKYNWKRMAQETLEIYKGVIHK
ncbi:MAG TPA: glycosyltransferase family 1 protein [Candidatus Moranbacteria bacterium]|nr:glycosyltransferase family 1 protein [Candidatus Moranbacteria bacterium]